MSRPDSNTVGYGGTPELYGMIYFDVIDDERLGRNGIDAYVALVRAAHFTQRSVEGMTRSEIADIVHMSPDSFDRGCDELKACGYLEVHPRYRPGTRARVGSRYVLFDTRWARHERNLRVHSGAEDGEPVDNPPQVMRLEPSVEGKTAGQGTRRQRQPKTGQSGAVSAVSGKGVRTQRQGLPHTAEALPYKEKLDTRDKPPSPPPSLSTAGATAEAEGEGEESSRIVRVVAEVLTLRPEWSASAVREALCECSDRPWPIVRRAMLEVAVDPQTNSPGRLRASGPWWARARAAVASLEAPPSPPWCGQCHPTNRLIEDPHTRDPLGPCPRCHWRNVRAS